LIGWLGRDGSPGGAPVRVSNGSSVGCWFEEPGDQVGAGMIMILRNASAIWAAHGQCCGSWRRRFRAPSTTRPGRCERPHPGAQLSLFEEHDGYRYQAFATSTGREQLAFLEARHRAHARVEDRIKTAKDTGLGRLPSREYANQAWVQIAAVAADLTRAAAAARPR
jgi:hypothetical protein